MMQKENSWLEYFLEARSILAYLGQTGILDNTMPKGLSLVGSRVHK